MVTQPLLSQFIVIGTLKDFEKKSKNQIKSLEIVAEDGTYSIKIAEELKNEKLSKKLKKGCLLKVVGIRKNDPKKGKTKYKAYEIELLDKSVQPAALKKESANPVAPSISPNTRKEAAKRPSTKFKSAKPKAKVLFCKKSTCWKKGGKEAYESLKAQLRDRGIASQVEVKTVGCLKQCKKAPNMVMMPDKARYSKVNSKQISGLINKHISSK